VQPSNLEAGEEVQRKLVQREDQEVHVQNVDLNQDQDLINLVQLFYYKITYLSYLFDKIKS
jgi:hypothetical protein